MGQSPNPVGLLNNRDQTYIIFTPLNLTLKTFVWALKDFLAAQREKLF